jgi:hypothetical protein
LYFFVTFFTLSHTKNNAHTQQQQLTQQQLSRKLLIVVVRVVAIYYTVLRISTLEVMEEPLVSDISSPRTTSLFKRSTHAEFHTITELLGNKFWEESNWFEIACEVLFHIKRRQTTVSLEIYTGLIQFVSCMYILPVIPDQLLNAGYDKEATYVVTVHSILSHLHQLFMTRHHYSLLRQACVP